MGDTVVIDLQNAYEDPSYWSDIATKNQNLTGPRRRSEAVFFSRNQRGKSINTHQNNFDNSIRGGVYNRLNAGNFLRSSAKFLYEFPDSSRIVKLRKAVKIQTGRKLSIDEATDAYDKVRLRTISRNEFAKKTNLNIDNAEKLYKDFGARTVSRNPVKGMLDKTYYKYRDVAEPTFGAEGKLALKISSKFGSSFSKFGVIGERLLKPIAKVASKLPYIDLLFAGASIAVAKERHRELETQAAGIAGGLIGGLIPPAPNAIGSFLCSLIASEVAGYFYDKNKAKKIKEWKQEIAGIKNKGGDFEIEKRMLKGYVNTGWDPNRDDIQSQVYKERQSGYEKAINKIKSKYNYDKNFDKIEILRDEISRTDSYAKQSEDQSMVDKLLPSVQAGASEWLKTNDMFKNNEYKGKGIKFKKPRGVSASISNARNAMDELRRSGMGKALASGSGPVRTGIDIKNLQSRANDPFNRSNTLKLANGGVLDKPTYALMGEAGAEAIIPLSGSRRSRGLELWQQTGRMLGAKVYANGGIIGGGISKISKCSPVSIEMGGINVTINGNGAGDTVSIMEAIKAQMPQIANDAANEMAKMLSKVWGNMTLAVEGN